MNNVRSLLLNFTESKIVLLNKSKHWKYLNVVSLLNPKKLISVYWPNKFLNYTLQTMILVALVRKPMIIPCL